MKTSKSDFEICLENKKLIPFSGAKKNKDRSGFTLLETLIYFGIFALIMGAIVKIEVQTVATYHRNFYQEQVSQNILHLANYLHNKLEKARAVALSQENYAGADYQILAIAKPHLLDSFPPQKIGEENYRLRFNLDNNTVDVCQGDAGACQMSSSGIWFPLLDEGVKIEANDNNFKTCFEAGADDGKVCTGDSECDGGDGRCVISIIEEDIVGPCLPACGNDTTESDEECDGEVGCGEYCSWERATITIDYTGSSDTGSLDNNIYFINGTNVAKNTAIDIHDGSNYIIDGPTGNLSQAGLTIERGDGWVRIALYEDFAEGDGYEAVTGGAITFSGNVSVTGITSDGAAAPGIAPHGELEAGNNSSCTPEIGNGSSFCMRIELDGGGPIDDPLDSYYINYTAANSPKCGDNTCTENEAVASNLNTCVTTIKKIKFHLRLSNSNIASDNPWYYSTPSEMEFTISYYD